MCDGYITFNGRLDPRHRMTRLLRKYLLFNRAWRSRISIHQNSMRSLFSDFSTILVPIWKVYNGMKLIKNEKEWSFDGTKTISIQWNVCLLDRITSASCHWFRIFTNSCAFMFYEFMCISYYAKTLVRRIKIISWWRHSMA